MNVDLKDMVKAVKSRKNFKGLVRYPKISKIKIFLIIGIKNNRFIIVVALEKIQNQTWQILKISAIVRNCKNFQFLFQNILRFNNKIQ